MKTCAIIPLNLLKDVLKAKRENSTDNYLADRFGYFRSKRMTPAVIYSTPDLRNVHCGSRPLIAYVGYKYSNRFDHSVGCYIDDNFKHIYPA